MADAAPAHAPRGFRGESVARFGTWLALLAVVAVGVRVVFVVAVDPEVPAVGDATGYHLLARNLADGDGYIRPFDDLLLGLERPTAEYPPLFPVLLAVPTLLGADGTDAQRLFLAVVGGATVALLGLLGRRVAGDRAGLLTATLAAVYPMLFLSEATGMAEALYVPLVVGSLLACYRAIERPSPGAYAVLGAVLGAATLTRAEGLLLGLCLVTGSVVFGPRSLASPRRIALGAIALGVMAACVLPWTVRNAVRLDALVPVSNNYATLVDGANCDLVYEGPQLGLWRETFSGYGDAARDRPQDEACFEGFDIADPAFDEAIVASRHRDDGFEYAREHLGTLPEVLAVRVARTWAVWSPGRQVDFESLEGRPRDWQMAGTVMFWVLTPFAVAGFVLLRRARVPVWPLGATLVVVTAVAALTYGQQRFRVAAEPAILVAAAASVTTILPVRSRGSADREAHATAD